MPPDNYNKSEFDFFVVALKEEARDVIWKVGAEIDPDTLVNSCIKDLQSLASTPDDERSEEEIWRQIRERLLKAAYAARPHCVRCGACCSKGSPSLTAEDIPLLRKNIIQPNNVMTVRKGEDVYSHITDSVEPAEREYIKIKEQPDQSTCVLFKKENNECSIYEDRPKQCRDQECWNPEQSGTSDVLLDREALLKEAGSLWEIIKKHEEKCSHRELKTAIAKLGATKGQTVEEILELLRNDHFIREWVRENFEVDPEVLSLFFGKPLKDSLPPYGLKVDQEPDGCFVLSPAEEDAKLVD